MKTKTHLIVPLFISHQGCPYRCAFCNQTDITGAHDKPDEVVLEETLQTYLGTIPEEQLPPHREVAFYGGSFTGLPAERQEHLLSLVQPWIKQDRVNAIRLSTHSLFIDPDRVNLLKKYRVTTIELGIQSTDSRVLELSNRPCSMRVMEDAVSLIKQNGFRLGLQLMPGLPGDNDATFQKSVDDVIRWQPDCVRLYPTLVVRHTKLYRMYQEGKFIPWTLERTLKNLATSALKFADKKIPIIRMGLHPDPSLQENFVDGPYHPSLRYLVDCRLGREQMENRIAGLNKIPDRIKFRVPKNSLSIYIGPQRENIAVLTKRFGLKSLTLLPDEDCEALQLVA